MSPIRPDLVAVWVFRPAPAAPGPSYGPSPGPSAGQSPGPIELLLIRRAPGRILPGLWQPVTGSIDPSERIALAALRELREETGIGSVAIETFYDLDQVALFHEPTVDGVLAEAVFAVRVRPGTEPMLSDEHDGARWASPEEAIRIAVWPAYRESIERIVEFARDPQRSAWLELSLDGQRKT